MKTLLKLSSALLVFGLIAAAPAVRAAAADKPAKKGAGQRLEKAVEARDKELIEKLALTDEQQTKLAEIRKTGAEQLKAAVGDRPKMREIVQKQHDDVRAMLTPEQQTKFDAMPAAPGVGKGKAKAKKAK